MESFYCETVPLPERGLPLLVCEHRHDSGGPGCEFHWHQELEFYYVITGGVLLRCGGEQEWLYPGDVGFVNSWVPHRGVDFLNETKHYIVQFRPDLLRNEIRVSDSRSYASLIVEQLGKISPFFHGDGELSQLFGDLVTEWNSQKSGMELVVKGKLLEIIGKLFRCLPQSAGEEAGNALPMGQESLQRTREILEYLSRWYHDSSQTALPVIAAEFGLSVPYLCRIFRRYTGRTVTGYLHELRCCRAAALIASGVPLTKAGEMVGMEDYNYFSRMFKKTTGHAPSDYRPGIPSIKSESNGGSKPAEVPEKEKNE